MSDDKSADIGSIAESLPPNDTGSSIAIVCLPAIASVRIPVPFPSTLTFNICPILLHFLLSFILKPCPVTFWLQTTSLLIYQRQFHHYSLDVVQMSQIHSLDLKRFSHLIRIFLLPEHAL